MIPLWQYFWAHTGFSLYHTFIRFEALVCIPMSHAIQLGAHY
jgi:hypothetical protein